MCSFDLLIFESGTHDFGLPFGDLVTFGKSRLKEACQGRTQAECHAVLLPAIRNQTWRLEPFHTYRQRLRTLTRMWARCRTKQPNFRVIFKLAPAPRVREQHSDCEIAQWGFSTQAHHMARANAIARAEVEAAGFEVFAGSFSATLHARAEWFDDVKQGIRYHPFESEAISDVLTQLLLNKLCNPTTN